MGTLVDDAFTDTNGTALTAHEPSPTGDSWEEKESSVGRVGEIQSNQVVADGNSNGALLIDTAQPNPAGVDVNAQIDIDAEDNADDTFWLVAYLDSANSIGVGGIGAGGGSPDNEMYLYEEKASVQTQLDINLIPGLNAGDTVRIEIVDEGANNSIVGKHNGGNALEGTSTVDPIEIGIGWGNMFRSGDDISSSWRGNNFLSDEPDVEAGPSAAIFQQHNVLLRM